MVQNWEEIGRKQTADYNIFTVNEVQRVSPRTGETHDFVVLDAPQAMNVIPVTEDGMVVMVRQYRHGIGRVMLEFPAGLIEPNELDNIEQTARRELLEETGYSCEFVVKTGSIVPLAAFYTGRAHTFAAFGCVLSDVQNLEPAEDIDVELVPLDTVDTLIEQGLIDHALDIASFHNFQLYIKRHAG